VAETTQKAKGQADEAVPSTRDRDAVRRRRIRPMRSGVLPARIEDVAERAGVSTATVSRVLRGTKSVRPETMRRVTEAVEALSYRPSGPAGALAGSRPQTHAVFMSDQSQAV